MRQVARYDSTVLIRGESGSGKELVARRIHELSARARRAVRPGQLRRDSARAARERAVRSREGRVHRRADARASGRFELADGGTLFLDEIGEMPPRHAGEAAARAAGAHVRARRRRPSRAGSTCASSRPRIATSSRASPRASSARISSIGSTCSRSACRRCASASRTCPRLIADPDTRGEAAGRPSVTFSDTALTCLAAYRWPGNVRELAESRRAPVDLVPGPARRTRRTCRPRSARAPRRTGPRTTRRGRRGGASRRHRSARASRQHREATDPQRARDRPTAPSRTPRACCDLQRTTLVEKLRKISAITTALVEPGPKRVRHTTQRRRGK